MTDISLPSGFEDLSEWKDWDLETMTLRSAKRSSSTMEELQSFYDALLPRMAEILEFLTTVKMSEDMKPENLSLLNLSKSMAEIAPAVEQFFEPTISFGYDTSRWESGGE
jgi:hypothetical protein